MRPVAWLLLVAALLCLCVGFFGLFLLNGQKFTHSVIGMATGSVALLCGVFFGRCAPSRRSDGWVIAALGALLAISCAIQLPSSYAYQKRFND